jgi:hypothetical protein
MMFRWLSAVFAAVLMVSACTTSGAPGGSPAGRYPDAAGSTATVAPAVTPPTQTQTGWGLIWDRLPSSFPKYPGAEPTQTGAGPASAVLNVPADARTAATWYANSLQASGFSTVGTNGPLEDGSYVIDSTGAAAGCRAQTKLVPLGASTTATIYLAAACPFR